MPSMGQARHDTCFFSVGFVSVPLLLQYLMKRKINLAHEKSFPKYQGQNMHAVKSGHLSLLIRNDMSRPVARLLAHFLRGWSLHHAFYWTYEIFAYINIALCIRNFRIDKLFGISCCLFAVPAFYRFAQLLLSRKAWTWHRNVINGAVSKMEPHLQPYYIR